MGPFGFFILCRGICWMFQSQLVLYWRKIPGTALERLGKSRPDCHHLSLFFTFVQIPEHIISIKWWRYLAMNVVFVFQGLNFQSNPFKVPRWTKKQLRIWDLFLGSRLGQGWDKVVQYLWDFPAVADGIEKVHHESCLICCVLWWSKI